MLSPTLFITPTPQYHVIPAALLSDEPIDEQDASSLRTDASDNGISYETVSRLLNDGTLLARVAAHPALLPEQGYTVVLNSQDIPA